MTKEELKAKAAARFASNPGVNELHVTTDGQCFKEWHDANEHGKTIGSRELLLVKRNDAKKALHEQLIEEIKNCPSIDAFNELKRTVGNKPHPDVQDALTKKGQELNTVK